MELYAEAFDSAGALDKLEGFASFHGPDFYGLSRNTSKVTLQRQVWTLPESLPFGQTNLKPLRAGEELGWRLQSSIHPEVFSQHAWLRAMALDG
jgi:dihydroorotase